MISVIVPVYNVKDYVEKCLESITNQTFKDIEIIVVDDGSTDGSDEIVDRIAEFDSRIKVFHKGNGGLMSAWMYGLKRSIGDYIGFVDSDDFIDITMYEKLYNKAIKHNADVVLCNHYYDMRSIGEGLCLHRNPIIEGYYHKEEFDVIKNEIFPKISRDYISPSRCTKLINRELLLANLKYCDTRISSAEDVNIMVPCLLGCKSFYYVDEPLYYYVCRNTSISRTFKESLLETYIILVNNLCVAIDDYGYPYKNVKNQLWNVYGYHWVVYVEKSELSFGEKVKQINKLYDYIQFKYAVDSIERGIHQTVYKMTVKYKFGAAFLFFESFKKCIRKIIGY